MDKRPENISGPDLQISIARSRECRSAPGEQRLYSCIFLEEYFLNVIEVFNKSPYARYTYTAHYNNGIFL